MKHRRGRAPRWKLSDDGQGLPERVARKWSWGVDPFKTVMFFLLAPALLIAGALGGLGWSWWERLLAGAGGLALGAYPVLALVGGWRLASGRRRQGGVER
ncbi:hypothetical protein ACFWZ2_37160 [Streptomyces sp. NPDC059002]|uniref:hypothetical protein n=1 Tax=Streptomyces sp. NPDC059002 TaxID=3346690 RepID=UPI003681B707